MPRYDDRYGGTRLYVGHLSSRTRSRDIEDVFSRYGRVRNVDLKHDFAFVDFSDPRDADDARHSLDGRDFDGSRIVVEFARGAPRGRGGSREYLGRGPAPGSGCCFNCGVDGHWARDCTAGDWRNKCYRCGERGHIERHCKSSPKSLRRGRSYSRSPSPHRGRGRSRSYSHSRSYSRSRTPPRRGGRTVERDDRLRSPRYSKSPPLSKVSKRSLTPSGSRSPPPSKGRKRSPSPYGSRSPPPSKGRKRSLSPDVSRSPSPSKGRIRSPSPIGSRSPPPSKGRIRSPSPNDGSGSPMLKGQKRSSSPNDGGGSPPLSKGRKHSPSPYGSRSPPEQIVQDGSDYGESPKANGRMLSPGDDDMKYPRMGSRSP